MHTKDLPSQSVSSASIRDLLQTCHDLALVDRKTLSALKKELPALDDPTTRIAEAELVRLWHSLEQHLRAKDAGLIIGSQINPSTKGILASWVSQCATLGEALRVFLENIALMNPSERWTLDEHATYCELTFQIESLKGYPVMAIERSMSALVAWAKTLSGADFPIMQACFTFSEPSYRAHYERIFGSQLRFNAASNTLRFNASLFDIPVVSANPLLKDMIETKASAIIRSLDSHRLVSDKVKQLIHESLPKQPVNIEQVSEAMAMSRQTLYRKLKLEETDFKTLLDDARKEKAAALLKEGKDNIVAISLNLGFQEPSSFYKAFKRWYGLSVKDFLERNKT